MSADGVPRLLNSLPLPAAWVSRAGRTLHVNQALAQRLGRPPEDLTGRPAAQWCEFLDAATPLWEQLDGDAHQWEAEARLRSSDGGGPKVWALARRADELAGDEPGLLLIFQDPPAAATLGPESDPYREIARLSDTVLEQALALQRYSRGLEEQVRERTAELHEANLDAIYMLAVASEARDADTGAHVRRIECMSRALARMIGHAEAEAQRIGYSAILHDVGKLHVPDEVLKKPGPLDAQQRELMQTHTVEGERMLSVRPFFSLARQIARSHHENWDGSGYPDGVARDAIPVAARIVHLVDVYDALRSARVYKPPWSAERALAEVTDGAGASFEPELVRAFTALLAREPELCLPGGGIGRPTP